HHRPLQRLERANRLGDSRLGSAAAERRRRWGRRHRVVPLPLAPRLGTRPGSGSRSRSGARAHRLRRLLSMITSAGWRALGTTASVSVTDPGAIVGARELLEVELDRIDLACSRFRGDSELTRVNEAAGEAVAVSDLLLEAI